MPGDPVHWEREALYRNHKTLWVEVLCTCVWIGRWYRPFTCVYVEPAFEVLNTFSEQDACGRPLTLHQTITDRYVVFLKNTKPNQNNTIEPKRHSGATKR